MSDWTDAQARVAQLAREAGDEGMRVTVPATPDWTALDLLAHVIGVGVEEAAGTATSGHPPEWTATTVSSRSGRSVTELLDEWDAAAADIAAAVDERPGIAVDLLVHEQDLRSALERPGARDRALAALPFYERVFDGLPALEVVTEGTGRLLGQGEQQGRVEVPDTFEWLRGLCGRRSEHQLRSWAWDVEPTPWLGLSRYGLRDTDLVEPGPLA